MQIDFHHAVTFVVARLAGFTSEQAATVAHASQYVDDATNAGSLSFTNGAGYTRIASAHKMLDYRNFHALANATVWVPFHFLPGNGGQAAGIDPAGGFIAKLICRPNSPPAQDMVQRCIEAHAAPYALHRLGITMHIYADTWAHQGFAGVSHEVNIVNAIADHEGQPDVGLLARLKTYFGDKFESLASGVADALPLGHGGALSHPDMPFLRWSYTNGLGERIERNNLEDFVAAVQHMFSAMSAFRRAAGGASVPTSMAASDLAAIRKNFESFTDSDGDVRQARWRASIAAGSFSFGRDIPAYICKGVGSWKHLATGSTEDEETHRDGYDYSPMFLTSDWKLFHDALQIHRLVLLHEILPRYGICVA